MVQPLDAAGGICSNAKDMAKWMMFQLRGGRDRHGRRLVPEKEFVEMHTPQNPTPLTIGKKVLKQPLFPISAGRFAYDLGWSSGTYRGQYISYFSPRSIIIVLQTENTVYV